MELSKKDRLILYNQYEILKFLNPEEKETYDVNQEILVNGYKKDYDILLQGFDEDVPEEICEFVYDVLQMYRCIQFSYNSLNEKEKKEYEKLSTKFEGFDGNEEPQYYFYACFLLEKMNLYEESYQNGRVETNSHSNKVSRYQKMLERWKEVRVGKYNDLTLNNIKYILGR